MTPAKATVRRLATTRSFLNSLIAAPDLARTIQALPPETFAALIRRVGIEDAGELVALATTEQLVRSFDEDLFGSEHAGERERFDAERFVAWLEVLLEAGDDTAAKRVAELEEAFVVHALGCLLFAFDEEALRQRLGGAEEDEAWCVDKALESALTEEIDGYVLVAKRSNGWDAALALVLALDRSHRALLVRLLDRVVAVSSSSLDDLEELVTALNEAESLADDVEAAREDRRSRQGYVEAQAARGFLALARKPIPESERATATRDGLTRAYFRELERDRRPAAPSPNSGGEAAPGALPPAWQRELQTVSGSELERSARAKPKVASVLDTFMEAMRELGAAEPQVLGERLEELAYLGNVLVSGHERDGLRMTPKAAADAALATVCFGAVLELAGARRSAQGSAKRERLPTRADFVEVLRARSADLLFRVASSTLSSGPASRVRGERKSGVLYSPEEFESALSA